MPSFVRSLEEDLGGRTETCQLRMEIPCRVSLGVVVTLSMMLFRPPERRPATRAALSKKRWQADCITQTPTMGTRGSLRFGVSAN